MANPVPNEEKVYERIEKEHMRIDPLIWDLVNHHVRNDLNWITMCIGLQRETPKWILNSASFLIKFLYKISRQPGSPPDDLSKVFDGTIEQVKKVDTFLKNLRDKTCKE